jgi:hypothetical protein
MAGVGFGLVENVSAGDSCGSERCRFCGRARDGGVGEECLETDGFAFSSRCPDDTVAGTTPGLIDASRTGMLIGWRAIDATAGFWSERGEREGAAAAAATWGDFGAEAGTAAATARGDLF